MDTYATATYLNHLQSIHILLFDTIYIRDFQVNLEGAAEHAPTYVIDMSYLASKGILVELPKNRISKDIQDAFSTEPQLPPGADPKLIAQQLMRKVADDVVRQWAMTVEATGGRCVPLMNKEAFEAPAVFGDQRSASTAVLDITIRVLPAPAVPLRQLAELRNEPVIRETFKSLRRWFTALARGHQGSSDVANEFVTVFDTYRMFLEARGMTGRRGALRVLVTAVPDVLANLAAYQPAGVFGELYSVEQTRVELLRSDASLPGREVVYLPGPVGNAGS